ncbi:carbohydrate kinase family protein [Salimicrobium halophilum]|uniref:Sugar or nucleoside kinase, ribokinase family n=1 Tax=Salimicrobium halophilum TaxID=86666 RepID=A0A1G8QZ40_9BACI|nr:carbohydrate kinase family protein [Salimicrobium halophilum]SDJ09941.1 Sugar or nucleoside kinase, ribokinase family [Salimicrobium halophilum]
MGKEQPIVCIGGANVDKKLYAKDEIAFNTSNPVTSSASVGGVARNIAENLGRLGEEVVLLTVRGDDAEWYEIEKASAPFMDTTYVHKVPGAATGSYTAVLDKQGDMAVAYADMDVFDSLTAKLLVENTELLRNAKCIVVDLNCPEETVYFLSSFASVHEIPLAVIPVSSPKMKRLPERMESIDWIIVNKEETETFFKMRIDSEESWKLSVERWLARGVRNVVVTNGAEGVIIGTADEIRHMPTLMANDVVDATGAGDSFCAGVLYAWIQGDPFTEVVQAGLVNSRKTVQSRHTVRKDLTPHQFKQDREEFIDGTLS